MGKLEERSGDPGAMQDKRIESEYLQVLATQASRVPLPVFVADLIIASLAASYFHAAVWGGWLVLVALILVTRWRVLGHLPSRDDIPIERRVNIAIWLSLANGLIHGGSLVFFTEFTIAERSIQTLILAGLVTGAVGTTAGHLRTFLAFTLPVILPLALVWGLYPAPDISQLTRVGIPLLVLFLGLIFVGLAKEYSRFFIDSFRIRGRQSELNEQLQKALDDAIAANEAKTRFLASASHDLRQPIHALSLFTGALMRRQHSPETTEILSHLSTAVENLASSMSTLLDMSKLDAGLVEPHPAPLDLRAYLDQLYIEFLPQAGERSLELELVGSREAHVLTDSEHFDRIMRNLLSNALHYTRKGGIRIELASAGDDWAITVRDTGMGIPESEQERIFEEFYQIDNPHRDRQNGLGLGLAIVKRLSSLLDIRIEVTSQEDAGTAFTLMLPKHQPPRQKTDSDASSVSLGGVRILCIDDESEVRAALEALLSGMGCQVETAAGTADGLERARASQPDILIADLRLADGDDGITSIRRLRELYPQLPALLITGDTAPDRLTMASGTGIKLLHKPISAHELTQAIDREIN